MISKLKKISSSHQLTKYTLLLLLLIHNQTHAEVILSGISRAQVSCGQETHFIFFNNKNNSSPELQAFLTDTENFTKKVLTLFRDYHEASPINFTTNKTVLRKLNPSQKLLSKQNTCAQYLEANYQLIATALAENQKNLNMPNYIPINVAEYFLQLERNLYPDVARREMFKSWVHTYLPNQPALRDYFSNKLSQFDLHIVN